MDSEQQEAEVLEYLKQNGPKTDSVDVACEFGSKWGEETVDVPLMALSRLEDAGKVVQVEYAPGRYGYKVI